MIYFYKLTVIYTLVFLCSSIKAAENIFLYRGTFSRTIKIEELKKFKNTKIANKKLKNLLKITNQNEEGLLKALSYEIEVPLSIGSKLMNSNIGEVILTRISKVIHPNKISNQNIGKKAIRSGIILSSFNNQQKINLLDFFEAYPNKDIAINLSALSEALKKVESLTELIEFYTDSPFKKLKDGSSST